MLELVPWGLFEPNLCSNVKWIITRALKIKGNKYRKLRNLFNVGLPTLKPPHTHITNSEPYIGIAVKKLVITVAAQKDMEPQTNTYPRKAVRVKIR